MWFSITTEHAKSGLSRRQGGMSIVSLMIGMVLITTLIFAAMKLSTFSVGAFGSSANGQADETLTQVGKFLVFNLRRAGGFASSPPEKRSIQLCDLQNTPTGRQCVTYQPQAASPCMLVPVVKDPSTTPKIRIQGFRLVDGVVEKKLIEDATSLPVNANAFCTTNEDWVAMHTTQDFFVDSLKLCNFNAATLDAAMADFSTDCESVLGTKTPATGSPRTGYWMVVFTTRPAAGASTVASKPMVTPLLNKPDAITL